MKTLDHDFDGIVSGFSADFISFNNHRIVQGVTSLRMMEQKTGSFPFSFYFNRDFLLIPEYNEIIRRLRDAGITEHWNNFFIRNEKILAFGPEVLTMFQLRYGFFACMIPMAMSIVAFFIELYSELIRYACWKFKKLVMQSWRRN